MAASTQLSQCVEVVLRQGVNRATFRLATSFWASASNMPRRAAIYPGRLTQMTCSTASKTRRARWRKEGWLEWPVRPVTSAVVPPICVWGMRLRETKAFSSDRGAVKMAINRLVLGGRVSGD